MLKLSQIHRPCCGGGQFAPLTRTNNGEAKYQCKKIPSVIIYMYVHYTYRNDKINYETENAKEKTIESLALGILSLFLKTFSALTSIT